MGLLPALQIDSIGMMLFVREYQALTVPMRCLFQNNCVSVTRMVHI